MADTRISIPGASLRAAHAQQQRAYLAAYTPETIADAALRHGDKRSAEYRLGLIGVLKFKMRGEPVRCPYPEGTAQFDAYYAGTDRGHMVWRNHQEQEGGRHD